MNLKDAKRKVDAWNAANKVGQRVGVLMGTHRTSGGTWRETGFTATEARVHGSIHPQPVVDVSFGLDQRMVYLNGVVVDNSLQHDSELGVGLPDDYYDNPSDAEKHQVFSS